MSNPTTLPSPISRSSNKRQPLSRGLRFAVLSRDDFTCQYCGSQPPNVTLEVDHIHPVAHGGTTTPGNLVTACEDCNQGKRARQLPDSRLQAIQEYERRITELEQKKIALRQTEKAMKAALRAERQLQRKAEREALREDKKRAAAQAREARRRSVVDANSLDNVNRTRWERLIACRFQIESCPEYLIEAVIARVNIAHPNWKLTP